MYKCPGTDPRYLKAGLYKCPNCSYLVEIFSDEVKTRCPKCKKDVYRKNTPSCVNWCKYARQCIGEVRWRELQKTIKKSR